MALEGDARKAEPSSARGSEEEQRATALREAPLILMRVISENAASIHMRESLPLMEANLDEARVVEEKPTDASRAVDDSLNSFIEGVDVGILEDYSGFGHLEIPKKFVQPGSGGPSSSSKLEK